ncbi:hypothetical protein CDD83_7984 [Cordyceps sp. RAO-2017]|nr:hypothetical protein CDD83_7984 [Cordyceps sp. RAO-2017]
MHLSAQFLVGSLLFLANKALSETPWIPCNRPETTDRLCYSASIGAVPQNLDVADVRAVAQNLREYGRSVTRFWTMNSNDAANCAEWTAFCSGSVMVFARLNGRQRASVSYEDIARTIDGTDDGVNSTEESNIGLLKCGSDGGQMPVLVNQTSELYQRDDYKKLGLTNEGIIIKLVKSNKEMDACQYN